MTELAPQFDPSAIESDIYQAWLDGRVFAADAASGADPYVIMIPLPNVTDVLHMGHGLNNTLQDVLIRFERMRGREALWMPGTDHAGIATQNVVERMISEEGKTRHDLGREAFVKRVWEHVDNTGWRILDQLKAIGASCDWDRTRFTLDDAYSAAVTRVFVSLHHDGLIYRGHRVIHWCPRCLTSLSDEEAEFHDREAQIFYIRYAANRADGVVIATTRPETIFADVCLVHNPDDERYAALTGGTARIPLIDVEIPIRTSARVEPDFGTGMLKVTPAHDANDFDIANELNDGGDQFDRPVIIDEHARMMDLDRVPADLHGLDRDTARTRTVEMLESAGALVKVESHQHAVRKCYRCNTLVEPRLSDQWFVKMKPLAEPALEAYRTGRVRFVPERWNKVYENWLSGIRDWNISRQLWWGHRVPAWYCTAEGCDRITVAETTPAACACGGSLVQDQDVLDTWFSSWLWPFVTLGWPEETDDLKRFYPGHTLVTSPDIIFFWVARMIMAGYHFMGDTPFETVYLHGVVRDMQHRKMSKSLKNGIDPLTVVERYGADALRYTMIAGNATGSDLMLDPDDLDTSFAAGRNFANKIWNVGRFILSNLDGAAFSRTFERDDLELADRWILSRTEDAVGTVTRQLEQFRFGDAAQTAYHFFWDELADWYVEQVKPRLYGSEPGGETARAVLLMVFEAALQILHPVMPFITEALWGHIPGRGSDRMLAESPWPRGGAYADPDAETQFGLVQDLVRAVRTIRAEYNVSPGKAVPAYVDGADPAAQAAWDQERAAILRLGKIDPLTVNAPPTKERGVGGHAVLVGGAGLFVPLGDAIDIGKECSRLSNELNRIDTLVTGVSRKLANENFVARAPAEVVDRERRKEQEWNEQRDTLAAKLHALGC